MIRVQVLSDLHFEFHRDGGESFLQELDPADVDVLVLAGDVCVGVPHLQQVLPRLAEIYPDIVYVFGNHELYHSSFKEFRQKLKSLDGIRNLHILDSKTVVIKGQRFVGTPLWFPDEVGNDLWANAIADFEEIEGYDEVVYQENRLSRRFLEWNLTSDDIVVTHYLPSERSVDPDFLNSPLNRFFVCPMDDLIDKIQPKLWIHGHTHKSMDYLAGNTRIVCNPLGYPHEINREFRDYFVLEV